MLQQSAHRAFGSLCRHILGSLLLGAASRALRCDSRERKSGLIDVETWRAQTENALCKRCAFGKARSVVPSCANILKPHGSPLLLTLWRACNLLLQPLPL